MMSQVKRKRKCMSFTSSSNCEYVNAIFEVCLTRHDCTMIVPFHSYVLYVLWAQIHTSFHSKYTFSSKKISKLKYSQYPV